MQGMHWIFYVYSYFSSSCAATYILNSDQWRASTALVIHDYYQKEALYVTETSESHTVHEGYSVQGCQAEYYIPRHQREAHAETNTPNLNNYTERSV